MRKSDTTAAAKITRRDLLKGTAALAAGAAAGRVEVVRAETQREVDVAVVGAGASGLNTARNLVQAGKRVAVIEANDRVGGRLKPGTIAGQTIDLGGQWVGPTQTRLIEIASSYGMKTWPQYTSGTNLLEANGTVYRYEGETPRLSPEAMGEFLKVIQQFRVMTSKIDPASPWTAPDAREWDSMTVETWIRLNLKSAEMQEMLRFCIAAVCSVEASQISFLEWLFYCKSGGTFEELIANQGGAQQDLYVGGLHQVTAHMAKELGDRVVLASPVRAIEQNESSVTVRADKGTWKAQRVVVTVPPSVAGRIEYFPALPPKREGLCQRMPMGSVIKCFLAYDTPFWKSEGLSGQVAAASSDFVVCFDHTPPGSEKGILVGFFDGAGAQKWADRSEAERREQVIRDVAKHLGTKAESPIEYVENNWAAEPWSKGGYTSVPGPGVLTHFGEALIAPCGRIHWAGTETADKWSGYVDGALRSGDRVAAEVLERLSA